MASISTNPKGLRRLLVVTKDGKRRAIRLGRITLKQAQALRAKVEALVKAEFSGSMDDETARWVANLGDTLHDKLLAVGLVAPRGSARLGPFIDGYIASRVDAKPSTATIWGHTRRCLVEHFGADKPLSEVTAGAADAWRLYLIGQGLADNTVRRHCGIAKQFFKVALRNKLITENPFADLSSQVRGNEARMFFVTPDVADKVLEACPDAQWRLIFALCRYGGLRCPSELLRLTWGDVDFDRMRLTIHSSKTEHHEGGGVRQVPIFPEVAPHLLDVFTQAAPGSEHVVTRCREPGVNLRTELARIITRAGLVPWPKLFQNLRSTRETELAAEYPLHIVVNWLGNSQPVALAHYLQITDADFERAVSGGAKSDARPAQKAAQKPAAGLGRVLKSDTAKAPNSLQPQGFFNPLPNPSNSFSDIELQRMGTAGLEPATPSL